MKKRLCVFIILISCLLSTKAQETSFTTEALIGKKRVPNSDKNTHLLPEVIEAFKKMQSDALKQGITIQIVSGYRNFKRQQYIFQKKYTMYKKRGFSKNQILNKIIEYSTIPGTSRHHWGTDFDIIQKVPKMPRNLLVHNNYDNDGPFCEMKQWMDNNAYKYGFYLVYTNNINRTGFKYEPWHYSYAPIAKKLLKKFLEENTKNNILPIIKEAGVTINNDFYSKYIQTHIKGINPLLLHF